MLFYFHINTFYTNQDFNFQYCGGRQLECLGQNTTTPPSVPVLHVFRFCGLRAKYSAEILRSINQVSLCGWVIVMCSLLDWIQDNIFSINCMPVLSLYSYTYWWTTGVLKHLPLPFDEGRNYVLLLALGSILKKYLFTLERRHLQGDFIVAF